VSKYYSDEFKESVIKKMMPPNPKSIAQLRSETGVSDVTLYKLINGKLKPYLDRTKMGCWH